MLKGIITCSQSFGQERGLFGTMSTIRYVFMVVVKFLTIVLQEQNISLRSFIYLKDAMPKLSQRHRCTCFIHSQAQGHSFKVRLSYWVGYLAHVV